MSRKNKLKGGIEPGKGITFTPNRTLDETEDWITEFNDLMVASERSRTQLIIDLIKKGLTVYNDKQSDDLHLTQREKRLIAFIRQNGLSDFGDNSFDERVEPVLESVHHDKSQKKFSGSQNDGSSDEQAMDRLQHQLKGLQM
ncbi:hypothetical protein [Sporolactobacillus sp. KGMB 08714]|uniref:hypothetical protein n=1 Tax=Sporolactobacillus sp. KGMB 08714 TaxID=3064704 RepID=UPI002FBD45F2